MFESINFVNQSNCLMDKVTSCSFTYHRFRFFCLSSDCLDYQKGMEKACGSACLTLCSRHTDHLLVFLRLLDLDPPRILRKVGIPKKGMSQNIYLQYIYMMENTKMLLATSNRTNVNRQLMNISMKLHGQHIYCNNSYYVKMPL